MIDVDILTDNIAHPRRMDFRYGSGWIRERVVQLLHHEATALLRGSYSDPTGRALLTVVVQAARLVAQLNAVEARVHALCGDTTAYLIEGDHEHAAALTRDALHTAGRVSSNRTVSRIRALQQQIRPLHSVGLAELNGEIPAFLHRAHDDEDITT